MTETPTPAQDLEALARLAGLLMLHTDPQESTIHDLAALKRALEIESDRHRALRDALVAEWNWDGKDDAGLDRATDRVLRAIASVGAEIVWPSPDSAETPESPAEARTAPGTEGVSDAAIGHYRILDHSYAVERFGFPVCPRAGRRWTASDGGVWEFELNESGRWELAQYPPAPTAREKILAEVTASAEPEKYEDSSIAMLLGKVITLTSAVTSLDADEPEYSRQRLIRAAALLVAAAERCDEVDAKRLDGAR